MKTISASIVSGALLVAMFGCGSGHYAASTPSATPSQHGYAKTSSMQEDTAGATTEDLETEASPAYGDEDAAETDGDDEADMGHAPAGGPGGPGTGGGP
jgi:hypothetical protein